jgi:hypothetical protein
VRLLASQNDDPFHSLFSPLLSATIRRQISRPLTIAPSLTSTCGSVATKSAEPTSNVATLDKEKEKVNEFAAEIAEIGPHSRER